MSDSQADRRSTRQRQTIPLRPLLGIHRDVSSTIVPAGGFTDVQGFLPSDTGLSRRYGFSLLNIEYPDVTRWDFIASFTDDRGVKITFGIADGRFYEVSGSGFTLRENIYEAGTITITANNQVMAGDGTEWDIAGGISRDDRVYVATGNPAPNDYEVFTVDTVVDDAQIKLIEVPLTGFPAGTSYYIERVMTPAADWSIQIKRLDRRLYIVTGKNTVMMYDIDDALIKPWFEWAIIDGIITEPPPNNNFFPKCIEIFKDRVWTGNIYSDKDARWYTTRVSWTPILSPSLFVPDDQFVDLIEVGGEIGCLNTLGNFLMVYFEFGIQFGRETAIPGDTFPLAFDVVDSARRGVLQPDAVASAVGGNFFVSTDNVYYIGQDLNALPISENCKELLFRPNLIKTRYKITNFFEAEGIAVGASLDEKGFTEIWAYNFSTKEWTYFLVNSDYFNVFALGSRLTYGDYPQGQIYSADPSAPCQGLDWSQHLARAVSDPLWWRPGGADPRPYDIQVEQGGDDLSNGYTPDSLTVGTTLVPFYRWVFDGTNQKEIIILGDNGKIPPTYTAETAFTPCKEIYGSASNVSASDRFYITNGRNIYVYDGQKKTDWDDVPIDCLMETGDLDLGAVDTYKTFYKMAMRLDEKAPEDIEYLIETSDDSGVTWYRMGKLKIKAGGKEGRCNFLHTGSATRFRLTTESVLTSYVVVELTVDVRLRGHQFGDF